MKWNYAATLALIILGSGCSTTGYPKPGRTIAPIVAEKGNSLTQDQQFNDHIQKEFNETLKVCQGKLSEMEGVSNRQRAASMWIYGVGLLAGSVIGPGLAAANAAKYAGEIAGLSGLAGASGLAGRALESTALSGGASAKDRNEIAKTVRELTEIAMTPTGTSDDQEIRLAAIRRMEAACIAYAITEPGVPAAAGPGK